MITRLNIGGPARQALILTRDLRPDFETHLVAGTPPSDEGELSDPGIDIDRLALVRPMSPVADLKAYLQLGGCLKRRRPDLLHTHMAKAGALARLASLRSGHRPKVVHTFHGHVLDGYFSDPVQRTFVQLERFLARRTDALIAVSDETRDQLLSLGIGDERRWHVIPLGFDLSTLLAVDGPSGELRASIGLGTDEPLVGVMGRLAPIKEHKVLIDAIGRLPGVHLVILGDGELRSDLQAHVRSAGLSERIHFVGWRLDIASVISDIDVMALTSRNEGTPVSLIEASAAARPVVSTDVGGVRSVVVDGITGILVPSGNEAAVADALARLLGSPDMRRRMGEAGRKHVKDRFAKDRLVADIKELYSSLLA